MNSLRLTSGQLHRHRTTHRGSDHTDGPIGIEMRHQCIEVPKDSLRAVGRLRRTRRKAKAEQIGDEQLKAIG